MKRSSLVFLGVAAAAVVLFVFLPPYWTFLATSAVIGTFVVWSVGVVFGRAGMVSLCQATFAGIGGWTVGLLGVATGVPFLVSFILGGLAAIPIGVLIGLPALRLRGVNLAVVTLGFASAMSIVVFSVGFPGARDNLPVARPIGFTSVNGFFVFAVFMLVFLALAMRWMNRTRWGHAWLAVRHSERATAAMGWSVPLTKLSAFATSAFIAGLGGGLLAAQLGFLNARNVEPVDSLVVFVIGVMVGAQYLGGALTAGILVAFFPEVLRRVGLPQDVGPILFAIGAAHVLSMGGRGFSAQIRDRIGAKADARAEAESDERISFEDVVTPASAASAWRPVAALDMGDRSGEPVLDVVELSVRYGAVVALDEVSIEVPERSLVGLIGPNGAGKSTFVDAVSGFNRRYEGQIRFAGKPLDQLAAHRRARAGIRRTFQRERTIPDLEVGQILSLAAHREVSRAEIDGILGFLDCPPGSTRIDRVDVGARRRLEIAVCLIARPRIILLDEPAAGLTDEETERLADALMLIPERFGCSVLLIEHDIELVRRVCDTAIVLDFGRVIASGTPSDVLADERVAVAYLGIEPDSDPEPEEAFVPDTPLRDAAPTGEDRR